MFDMKLIKTIRDGDIGFDSPAPATYEERSAARAIVADAIATLESETSVENYEGRFIRLRDLTFLQEAARF